jgi:glycerol kinase
MSKIVMALDQGTTSSRTILYNEQGEVIASAGEAFPSLYPRPGWVEQDPQVLWKSQRNTIEAALGKAGISFREITAVGIANQRETVIAWDKESGVPVHHAIVWQCRRTADFCNQLIEEGYGGIIREKTGLVTDAYFSATKMRWILKTQREAQELAAKGRLLFGTVDSWLLWKLTGGKVHATDVSNASRTMLFNIHTFRWDEELLDRMGIPEETLPKVNPSCGLFGMTDPTEFGCSVPISGVAGDQQAALFGQACFEKGMIKNTYGTGCFMVMNTGHHPVESKQGLLTTIAWQIGEERTYALEGSIFVAGGLMQWMSDELGFFEEAEETEKLAESVGSSGGVYIVPAFVGLGAPHWDPYARGAIFGLTRGVTKNHLVRAGLESMAYQSFDLLQGMMEDSGLSPTLLRVDGGACANNFLCQTQADLLGITVSRPKNIESTATGAAFLAGLASGIWKNLQTLTSLQVEDRSFRRQRSPGAVDECLRGWRKAVKRSLGWIDP